MDILVESIKLTVKFHSFQRFTKQGDISLESFISQELKEWNELSTEARSKVKTVYRALFKLGNMEQSVYNEDVNSTTKHVL